MESRKFNLFIYMIKTFLAYRIFLIILLVWLKLPMKSFDFVGNSFFFIIKFHQATCT